MIDLCRLKIPTAFWKRLPQCFLHGIVVLNFSGQPVVELKEGNVKPKLQVNSQIPGDVYVKTKANEFVIFMVNEMYSLAVLPGSEVVLEGVKQNKNYEVRSIYILEGQTHIERLESSMKIQNFFKSPEEKTKTTVFEPMKIESPFFSFLTQESQKLSLYSEVKIKTALLSVCNLGEDFKLQLFNHEVAPILKANEGIKFQGVLDDAGKVAYDILLEKRKVPQGKWLDKTNCKNTLVKDIQAQAEKNQLSEKQKNEKELAQHAAQKKKDDSRFLCHKPYGQLNQCHFILKKTKCFRERCNAEGKWADSEEVSGQKNRCTPAGEVRACGF